MCGEQTDKFKEWSNEALDLTVGTLLMENFPDLFMSEIDEDTMDSKVEVND